MYFRTHPFYFLCYAFVQILNKMIFNIWQLEVAVSERVRGVRIKTIPDFEFPLTCTRWRTSLGSSTHLSHPLLPSPHPPTTTPNPPNPLTLTSYPSPTQLHPYPPLPAAHLHAHRPPQSLSPPAAPTPYPHQNPLPNLQATLPQPICA